MTSVEGPTTQDCTLRESAAQAGDTMAALLEIAAALVYREPGGDLVDYLAGCGLFEGCGSADAGTGLPGDDLLERGAARIAAALPDAPSCLPSLRREWLRLFAGVGEPQAPSWANFYLDPESRVLGAQTLAVRKMYARYGLRLERVNGEPDDNLGLMLRFLAHLVRLGSRLSGGGSGGCLTAGSVRDDQVRMLRLHILPWIGAWHCAVEGRASSDFYRGAGDFVMGVLVRYAASLGFVRDSATGAFRLRRSAAAENVGAAS